MSDDRDRLRQPGVAYLLSMVGAVSSRRWEARMAELGLDPRDVVVLRMVAAEPGRTQRSLVPALQVPASRIVALVDRMERDGLLERRPQPRDRRAHALYVTSKGRRALDAVMRIGREHEDDLTEGLSDDQRLSLEQLLLAVAVAKGLPIGGHPGVEDDGGRRPGA